MRHNSIASKSNQPNGGVASDSSLDNRHMPDLGVGLARFSNCAVLAFKCLPAVGVSKLADNGILLAFLEPAAGQVDVPSFAEAGLIGRIPTGRYVGPFRNLLVGNESGAVDVNITGGIHFFHQICLGDHSLRWRRKQLVLCTLLQ